MENRIKKLKNTSPNPELIEKAFEIAKTTHEGQKLLSKEDYINHPIRVAENLNRMKMDSNTITASLLHNVLDNKPESQKKIELKRIEKKTNEEVAFLVKKVSDLKKIPLSLSKSFVTQKKETKIEKERLENLKRMFLAIAGDLRVVLIKLFSRLDNLNTLSFLPPEKQKLYALETLHILSPITDRLGIRMLRAKLEDLSFFYLYPEKYEQLKSKLEEKHEEREKHLRIFAPQLKKILEERGIKVLKLDYRIKSYWSTYQKLLKNNMDFEKVHDLIALRVIVENIKDCYKSIGIIHEKYSPVIEEIDDFIAQPKPDGYRSLHTTVSCEKGKITEIQIKTLQMHKYEIRAHWAYKENINLQKTKDDFDWTKEIPKIAENFEINFFKDRVFVFTPKKDIINLPKEATPVDFAYAIHTNIGNHCESAKINGKLTTISTPLKNGDLVEIITNENKNPSQDWLNFVKTNFAKNRIKKQLKKKGVPFRSLLFSLKTSIFKKKKQIPPKKTKKLTSKVMLGGQKGTFKIKKAKCCLPQEGDEIKAYITEGEGASLHKVSCKNFKELSEKFPKKVMKAFWIKD